MMGNLPARPESHLDAVLRPRMLTRASALEGPSSPRLYVAPTEVVDALAASALGHVVEAAMSKGRAPVLGMGTGETLREPTRRFAEQNGTRLQNAVVVYLDEYWGVAADDENSFAAYARRNLIVPTNIDPANVHVPLGEVDEADLPDYCQSFDALVASLGPVDLQLFGLGLDKHLAFVAPGTPWTKGTHRARLSELTRSPLLKKFGGDAKAPRFGITQGPMNFRQARECLVVVKGTHKAKVLAEVLNGEIGEHSPASFARTLRCTTFLADTQAASAL